MPLTFTLASTALFAQTPGTESMEPDPVRQTEQLMKQLVARTELSDGQIANLTDIHKDFFTQADQIIDSGTPDQLNKLIKENDSRISEILGREDFIRYKETTKQTIGTLFDKIKNR